MTDAPLGDDHEKNAIADYASGSPDGDDDECVSKQASNTATRLNALANLLLMLADTCQDMLTNTGMRNASETIQYNL